jgi:transposase-like protein
LAALKGDKTMSELATQFDVHPNQITQWKDHLLDGVANVFDDRPQAAKEPEIDVTSLHAKIGQLTLETDFLEGALAKAGLLPSARR